MRKKYRDREKNRNMIGREKPRKKVREIHNKGEKETVGVSRWKHKMVTQIITRKGDTKRLPSILC